MKAPATANGSHRAPRPWRCAAAFAVFLAACGDDHLRKYPQTTFRPTTEFARVSDGLFWLALVLGIVVGVVVLGILGYSLWNSVSHPGQGEPKQIHGNTRLEVAWTLIPAVILAVIAIPTVKAIFQT